MIKKLKNISSALFGTFHWKSPRWLSSLHKKAKDTPKTFWSLIILSILSLAAVCYAIHWYKNLPQPIYTTAVINAPAITPNEEDLNPAPLVIDFGVEGNEFLKKSVAPLSLVGTTLTKGIEMSPEMPGTWNWTTDSQLTFLPAQDWPAGQTYTLTFSENFFAAHANLSTHRFHFSTQQLMGKIKEFKLYQDPLHSEIRKAIATIEFNFPINPESVEKNTTLIFQTKKSGTAESQPFTYTYDKHKRIAYLQSDLVKIKDVARFLNLTLSKDIQSETGSGGLAEAVSGQLEIPSAQDLLKVVAVNASIVRNDKDRPEQILTFETTLGINDNEFNKSVHVYLLPKDRPATRLNKAEPNYSWQNPGEITPEIIALSTPLTKEALPTEQNYARLHSYKFTASTPQYLYVKIDKGLKGFGGFSLTNEYSAVLSVPPFPKEISFLHKGSLLALNSEQKLSVLVRGVPAVKFDISKVLPENINQLVTQTGGDFNNPYFLHPSFNQKNISQIFSEIQQFDTSDPAKQQYTALDFSKYLTIQANATRPQGLFLLQATGWDTENKLPLNVKASRLVLITDLALLVKNNADGSHDVFVDSITQGTPVANATVSILGKNGLSILSRTTDDQGRANFPNLNDFVEDREPTVYLAQLNNDISFIPYNQNNRQINISKFDTGGIYIGYNENMQTLRAYLFSDRGIYRPGDTAHIGMILKQAYAKAQPAGLPLQVSVLDSRGTTIKDQKMTLNETGYLEFDVPTNSSSPTGQYTVNVYLVKDNYPQNLLGSATIRVSEFLPDRMRMTAHLLPKPLEGWSSPTGLKAKVNLWNLYGAPAVNRTVTAKVLLVPKTVQFDKYPDYAFVDPLIDPKKPAKVFTDSLTATQTNNQGDAEFDLNLDRFEKATYQLKFFAEGFEADGGRSVTSQAEILVSPLPYFVGYKADGDLSFIKQNSSREVNYIAVNPALNTDEVKDLRLQLISLHPITTLVKKDNGTYQYQSIIQSTIVSTTSFNIEKQGTNYQLPTQQIGDFSLSVLAKDDTVLNQLKFSVVGSSQQPLAKNAELTIKLNKEEYQAGEDIEIQITSPYTGSGLITIERDKVYATHWFKTDTTNSIQTIHIPADFQGNGYVNVAFVRDWNSPEIFISPLSYSIASFVVNHDQQDIKINLNTPKVSRPDEPLTIEYSTEKPGKIIVYAVDEGILQVAKYEMPDPLAFFFQKYALEVNTEQTVDQIMPQFIQNRELSAVGGDAGEEDFGSHLNPFKRKTDLPVVFWSGIVDADNTPRQLVYDVPDYYNGTLKIMAIAVATDAIGAKETSTEIRGDFIINPNVPTFVAPGDEFDISTAIVNNLKNEAKVIVELTATPEVEIVGSSTQTVDIATAQEQTVHFKLKATPTLGSATLDFKVLAGNKSAIMSSTLSVRPATPLMTYVNGGQSSDVQKILDIQQNFYPEYRDVKATLSTSPLILIFGLQRYLDNFPYGCTEQLVSKVMPLLAMNNQTGFGNDAKEIAKKIKTTLQMLSQRQMSTGAFSYWPELSSNLGDDFASVYAMHFMTEAKEQGFDVPSETFANGLNYLKTLASQQISELNAARIQAYAIYILTRNEIVTTNYITNLQLYLEKNYAKQWKNDVTLVYIAGAYQLLQSHDEAIKLIKQYTTPTKGTASTDFYDPQSAEAQYLYMVAKHFPELLPTVSNTVLMRIIQVINSNDINTITSGYTCLALGAFPKNMAETPLSMTKIQEDHEQVVAVENANYVQTALGIKTKQIRFNNPGKAPFYYQLIQSGFEKTISKDPLKQGMEIVREYRDDKGNVINETSIGSEIEVRIQIRSLDQDYITNVAIEDLLPGGFEVVSNSVKNTNMEFVDVREDRVIYFGTVESNAKSIVYKIKAISKGKYTVPPAFAKAMYHPNIFARAATTEISVQ